MSEPRDPNPFLDEATPAPDTAEPTLKLGDTKPGSARLDGLADGEPTLDLTFRRPVVAARPGRGKYAGDLAAIPAGDLHEGADEHHESTLVDLDRDQVLAAAAPARKRVRWGRWLAVMVVVLALLVAVGAVIGESYTRRVATDRIREALSTAFNANATATIADPLVLRSLMGGKIGQIDFSASDASLKTNTSTVAFKKLSGVARDISSPTKPELTIIKELSGEVLLEWAEVSTLAGVELRYEPDGRIRVDRVIEVLGADLNVQIIATPSIDPTTRKITLNNPTARASSIPVPGALLRAAIDRFAGKLELPALPSMNYRSITSTPEGLKVTVRGNDVKLSELR